VPLTLTVSEQGFDKYERVSIQPTPGLCAFCPRMLCIIHSALQTPNNHADIALNRYRHHSRNPPTAPPQAPVSYSTTPCIP
jgi:hypothetical protein